MSKETEGNMWKEGNIAFIFSTPTKILWKERFVVESTCCELI